MIISQEAVFDTKGDTLMVGSRGTRDKTLNSVGAVCKLEWQSVGNHPYTGVFKGSDSAFARFSTAVQVNTEKSHMVPGIAVKLLRDDFKIFLQALWSQLDLPSPTRAQYAIADYLQHGPKRLQVQAFRGVGKSWITGAFVLWTLFNIGFLIICKSQFKT